MFTVLSCSKEKKDPTRILIFSKTTGFRHESIPDGIKALKALAEKNNIIADTTENAANFN